MQHARITEMKVIDKQYVEKMEHELNELRARLYNMKMIMAVKLL